MSEPDRRENPEIHEKAGIGGLETEGDQHPADLLVSLLNADSGGNRRASGPQLPINEAPPSPAPAVPVEKRRGPVEVPPAARGLASAPVPPPENEATALQRTLRAVTTAWPLIQRLLPLLDGNVVSTIGNLLMPHSYSVPHTMPPQRPVDLGPIESGLNELKTQQGELRTKVHEQVLSLQRMADHLEQVRDATERNTREQQELIDELKASGRRVNVLALLAFALLAGSIAVNVFLYLEIHKILP